MNYRPYPNVDRALAQLERGRVPSLSTTLRIDTSALEAALSRFRDRPAPRPQMLAWIDEHLAPETQLTDWQRAFVAAFAGPAPASAVLSATTGQTADRAAVLREAADRLAELRAAEREWLPATGLHKGEQELRRMAGETPAAETEAHVCKPGASVYYCPTSGETESDCHGGFDVCCDRPDLHQPAGARQDGAQL